MFSVISSHRGGYRFSARQEAAARGGLVRWCRCFGAAGVLSVRKVLVLDLWGLRNGAKQIPDFSLRLVKKNAPPSCRGERGIVARHGDDRGIQPLQGARLTWGENSDLKSGIVRSCQYVPAGCLLAKNKIDTFSCFRLSATIFGH